MQSISEKESIEELFLRQEPLCRELRSYLRTDRSLPYINHPFVQSMFHVPQMNALVNAQYRQKASRIQECRASGDYSTVVWLHERPYRVDALKECSEMKGTNPALWWKLLGEVWIDSENIWQHRKFWDEELETGGEHRREFMDEEDRAAFDLLDWPLVIYRGCERRNQKGLSWTLDKDRAEWFAARFMRKNPMVLTAMVSRADVLAHLIGRGESEIVILPSRLKQLQIAQMT